MAKSQEKTEKLQVLISEEDLTDLTRKISKEALSKGEAPISVSHYIRKLIRKDLGKTTEDQNDFRSRKKRCKKFLGKI